jgi:SAM-dependent methyltransferase
VDSLGKVIVTRPEIPVCDYEGSEYQSQFWEQADRAYEDRVEAVALHRLMPSGGRRLLEVGAGAGRNTLRYPHFDQLVLLDYSRTQLEQARRQLGDRQDLVFVVGDAYRLPFGPAAFDAATMIRTLHHMAEPAQALAQVAGVLVPGAEFVLEYASKRHLKAILRWGLRRQGWSPFDARAVEFADLNFDFHPDAVNGWLRQAGLVVERRLGVSFFRHPVLKRMVPLRVLVWGDALAQVPGGWWPITPSVFVRARRPGTGTISDSIPWRCPECQSLHLEETNQGLACQGCGRVWGQRDGIYDFKTPAAGPRAE